MWKKPELNEIKMDAEIGSYHEDDSPPRDAPPFCDADARAAREDDEP